LARWPALLAGLRPRPFRFASPANSERGITPAGFVTNRGTASRACSNLWALVNPLFVDLFSCLLEYRFMMTFRAAKDAPWRNRGIEMAGL